MRDVEKTISSLIDKMSVSYIGTVDEQGYPAIRAMLSPREREGIKYFYYSTNMPTQKVSQILANPKTCLYFCDKRFYRGVMLRGTMEVLTDIAAKQRIWRDGDELYYPDGKNSNGYCVLKFSAELGRYYSHFKTEDFVIQ